MLSVSSVQQHYLRNINRIRVILLIQPFSGNFLTSYSVLATPSEPISVCGWWVWLSKWGMCAHACVCVCVGTRSIFGPMQLVWIMTSHIVGQWAGWVILLSYMVTHWTCDRNTGVIYRFVSLLSSVMIFSLILTHLSIANAHAGNESFDTSPIIPQTTLINISIDK